jgi:hypothetical protein
VQEARALLVDALERACAATRLVEWVPGWHRIYPQCLLARWSAALDHRWSLGKWSPADDEEWETWFDNLPESELQRGHWHHW